MIFLTSTDPLESMLTVSRKFFGTQMMLLFNLKVL